MASTARTGRRSAGLSIEPDSGSGNRYTAHKYIFIYIPTRTVSTGDGWIRY